MRSNIAWTWGSESVPLRAPGAEEEFIWETLLECAEVVDERVEAVRVQLAQARVGRHRRGGVHERAGDRLALHAAAHVREVRSWAGVAVLAHPVTAQAA